MGGAASREGVGVPRVLQQEERKRGLPRDRSTDRLRREHAEQVAGQAGNQLRAGEASTRRRPASHGDQRSRRSRATLRRGLPEQLSDGVRGGRAVRHHRGA